MNWLQRFAGRAKEPTEVEALDPALKQALGDFKSSVHAWSEAVYSQPRTVHLSVAHRTWRLAAGWAIAGVLLAGAVSGGVYEHHQRQEQARIAAREAAQQRQLAAQRARAEEDLLAKVDSDVSREVPSALEPLAQLMTEDATR
ncbi:MAG TPA: hypothetical protein VMV39_09110 [Terracidiphilus sp.]|nr:hypothetical protein [Terracidiphilus sp.]